MRIQVVDLEVLMQRFYSCLALILLFTWPVSSLFAQEKIEISNPGFEETDDADRPNGWFSSAGIGSGYSLTLDSSTRVEGEKSALLEKSTEGEDGFGVLSQSIDAQPYRGRRVRLTANVKAGEDAASHRGLWLRVDRSDEARGFFDNMNNRSITDTAWRTYSIEGDVSFDAEQLVFGLLLTGNGQAWVDAFKIEDIGSAKDVYTTGSLMGRPRTAPVTGDIKAASITDHGLQNLEAFAHIYGLVRWFHPSGAATTINWDNFSISAIPKVEAARSTEELVEVLQETFLPVAPSLQLQIGTLNDEELAGATATPVVRWEHFGLGGSGRFYHSNLIEHDKNKTLPSITRTLANGVTFRLPLAVPRDNEASGPSPASLTSDKPANWIASGFDRTTRLASVIKAWAILSHFYPYWDVVDVDWNATLTPALADAAIAPDDMAFRITLQRLVAGIQDGHGFVTYADENNAVLPIDWTWVDEQLVVTAVSQDTDSAAPGMIVETIDGVSISVAAKQEMGLVSGSEQHKRSSVLTRLRRGRPDAPVSLTLTEGHQEPQRLNLRYSSEGFNLEARQSRPPVVSELRSDVLYVDLTRINQQELDLAMVRLSTAGGVIFDLRGYPRSAGLDWLRALLGNPVRSQRFQVPRIVKPYGDQQYPSDDGWELNPVGPKVVENAVFLTDARAISYAETILSIVKANQIGMIVGTPTAGANGNIAGTYLPGGYGLIFTGMQVTNRDGTPHHLIGVVPDRLVKPTVGGIREGRDEVLNAGLQTLLEMMNPAPQHQAR